MVTSERTRSFEREAMPHLDAVHGFALRLTRSPADADDLVQETFLRGYRSWHRFQPGTRARSWLFTICRNAFVRQREREIRRSRLAATATWSPLLDVDGAESPRTFAAPDAVVAAGILRKIDELPPDFRSPVLLCDLHSLGYEDAARRLHVPIGTLKSRLHRGRAILRSRLRNAASELQLTS
jgi:RNA polymerase sigma-70 factor (ECF subfamily)